uniref:Putative La1-like peptide n=1 Tax=Superstitionia donensis TaxID=311983 RepID=A0A1V1WBG4_9SCOR
MRSVIMEPPYTAVLLGLLLAFSVFNFSMGFGESCKGGPYSIIPVGQEMTDPTTCTSYKCINYNRKYVLQTSTCATVKPPCKGMGSFQGNRFPNCCPIVTCTGG